MGILNYKYFLIVLFLSVFYFFKGVFIFANWSNQLASLCCLLTGAEY